MFIIYRALILLVLAPSAQAADTRLSQSYKLAAAQFDKKDYKGTIKILDPVVKRYPAHVPSRTLLARSYYKLGQLNVVRSLFENMDPKSFDPETAYEYGVTKYYFRSWELALSGFERVPAGHPLDSLANYYGGLCAYQLRQYKKAETLFLSANELPEKQGRLRSLYLKQLRKSLATKPTKKAREPVVEKKPQKEPQKEPEPQPVVSYGFYHPKTLAKLGFQVGNQNQDFTGIKEQDLTSNGTSFVFGVGGILETGKVDHQSSGVGLELKLGAESFDVESGYMIRSTIWDPLEKARSFRFGVKDGPVQSGFLDLAIHGEIALGQDLWVGASGRGARYDYDFDSKYTLDVLSGEAFFGGKTSIYEARIFAGAFEIGEAKGPIQRTSFAGFDGHRWVGSRLKVSGALRNEQNRPEEPSLPIHDWGTRAELGLGVAIEPLIFLGGDVSHELKKNMQVENVAGISKLAYDESITAGQIYVDLNILEFLRFRASSYRQRALRNQYAPDDSQTEQAVNLNIPNYMEEFTVSGFIDLIF